MNKHCQSCGMPLAEENNRNSESVYCAYCTNKDGTLKKREEVQIGIAEWLKMFTPDESGSIDFSKRANSYLQAMPAWAGE